MLVFYHDHVCNECGATLKDHCEGPCANLGDICSSCYQQEIKDTAPEEVDQDDTKDVEEANEQYDINQVLDRALNQKEN